MGFCFFTFFQTSCPQRFSKSFEQNIAMAFHIYVLDETVLDFILILSLEESRRVIVGLLPCNYSVSGNE